MGRKTIFILSQKSLIAPQWGLAGVLMWDQAGVLMLDQAKEKKRVQDGVKMDGQGGNLTDLVAGDFIFM